MSSPVLVHGAACSNSLTSDTVVRNELNYSAQHSDDVTIILSSIPCPYIGKNQSLCCASIRLCTHTIILLPYCLKKAVTSAGLHRPAFRCHCRHTNSTCNRSSVPRAYSSISVSAYADEASRLSRLSDTSPDLPPG